MTLLKNTHYEDYSNFRPDLSIFHHWDILNCSVEHLRPKNGQSNHSNLNKAYLSDFNDAILNKIHFAKPKSGLFKIF